MTKKIAELRKNFSPVRTKTNKTEALKMLRRYKAIEEVRHALGLTQKQLSQALGVTQPSYSQMEKQEDMRISTLKKIIKAMGGTLELVACLPDKKPVVLEQFS